MPMKKAVVSMLALFLLAGCGLAQGAEPLAAAKAEPSPASTLDACQRYATGFYKKISPEHFASIVLLEENFNEEKYEDKVGSQFVSTVLSGEGIWKDKTGGPSTVHFLCLLQDSKTPVFFDVLDEEPRDPVAACWDAFEPSGWDKITRCLEGALKREEAALAEEIKKVTEQAKQSMDKLSAEKTLKASNAQWVQYRDGECDRRMAAVMGRNHPDLDELTCKIRKTADRIADFRFDE